MAGSVRKVSGTLALPAASEPGVRGMLSSTYNFETGSLTFQTGSASAFTALSVKDAENIPAASNTMARAENLVSHFISSVPPKKAAMAKNQLEAMGKASC